MKHRPSVDVDEQSSVRVPHPTPVVAELREPRPQLEDLDREGDPRDRNMNALLKAFKRHLERRTVH